MPLPADVTTCTLTFGPYTDSQGNPYVGLQADITPTVSRVTDVVDGSVVLDAPVVMTTNAEGSGFVVLPHTDQQTITPYGFGYDVVFRTAAFRSNPGNKRIVLPKSIGTEADYDTMIASVAGPLTDVPVAKGDKGDTGPAGKSAYQVAVDNGFVGTQTEWLNSLEGPAGPVDTTSSARLDSLEPRVSTLETNYTGVAAQASQASTDASNAVTTANNALAASFTDEKAQDAVANALVAGDNVTITYDDTLNTISIGATAAPLSYANALAGSAYKIKESAPGSWTGVSRPSGRSDLFWSWRGSAAPPIVSSGTGGALDGVDDWEKTS